MENTADKLLFNQLYGLSISTCACIYLSHPTHMSIKMLINASVPLHWNSNSKCMQWNIGANAWVRHTRRCQFCAFWKAHKILITHSVVLYNDWLPACYLASTFTCQTRVNLSRMTWNSHDWLLQLEVSLIDCNKKCSSTHVRAICEL